MVVQKNRDGSWSAFLRIGHWMVIAEGWTRPEAIRGLWALASGMED